MPMPDPDTVTLTEPVLAVLPRTTLVGDVWSYEMAPVEVPTRTPAVTMTRIVLTSPPELRQRTLESDAHALDSHAVPPIRAVWL